MDRGMVSVNAQTDINIYVRKIGRSKASKIASIIVVSNEYTSKILGQDVSIRPLLDSNENTGQRLILVCV